MDSTYSIPLVSMAGSPLREPSWEQWEARLFALTDQIEALEDVPIEYAYHLAQMRLGMICEAMEVPSIPEQPDEPNLLLY